MGETVLDAHTEMLLEEYRQQQHLYRMLQGIVGEKLNDQIRKNSIPIASIGARIKTEQSLLGKLQRKGNKYHSLFDITDILGARIVAYYNEDVDRIASIAESLFDIDWPNSVDKRKMHQADSFGYNSLHYICRLPESVFCDSRYPELNQIRFELQMRTALQHVWSDIQHDIGYKTEIETPFEYHRSLSRLAGLLELADNEFSRIRNDIADYRRRMQTLLQSGKLSEVSLDGNPYSRYLEQGPFDKLNHQIAAINQAELHQASALPYLPVLIDMGMKTLGDIQLMLKEDSDDAYQLALYQLGATDIDILSETVGIQNLCIVHILKSGKGLPGLRQMLDTINGISTVNESIASLLYQQAMRLSFMNSSND